MQPGHVATHRDRVIHRSGRAVRRGIAAHHPGAAVVDLVNNNNLNLKKRTYDIIRYFNHIV